MSRSENGGDFARAHALAGPWLWLSALYQKFKLMKLVLRKKKKNWVLGVTQSWCSTSFRLWDGSNNTDVSTYQRGVSRWVTTNRVAVRPGILRLQFHSFFFFSFLFSFDSCFTPTAPRETRRFRHRLPFRYSSYDCWAQEKKNIYKIESGKMSRSDCSCNFIFEAWRTDELKERKNEGSVHWRKRKKERKRVVNW